MAQRRRTVLVDDLDGNQAEHTVQFSLDGQQYEIDLSTANRERFRDTLAPFLAAARRARSNTARGSRPAPAPRKPAQPSAPEQQSPPVDEPAGEVRRPEPAVPVAVFSSPIHGPRTSAAGASTKPPAVVFSPKR